ncbi:MAG: DUF1285 domain-containing protein [Candidatus Dadabacteria bacterium]|nr:DUF1285 domain-containing protein [Candidatus Dadabacteria bacterium]
MKEPIEKTDVFQPRIYIDKEGNWYQDGVPILHRWTYLYNNSLLRRDETGRYYVDEGRGKVYVYVEDTPFVVKMTEKRSDGFYLILNDETEEKLDFYNLKMNDKNVPYVTVKNGEFEARFSRPAYYEFTKYLNQEGDRFYIEVRGTRYELKAQK